MAVMSKYNIESLNAFIGNIAVLFVCTMSYVGTIPLAAVFLLMNPVMEVAVLFAIMYATFATWSIWYWKSTINTTWASAYEELKAMYESQGTNFLFKIRRIISLSNHISISEHSFKQTHPIFLNFTQWYFNRCYTQKG